MSRPPKKINELSIALHITGSPEDIEKLEELRKELNLDRSKCIFTAIKSYSVDWKDGRIAELEALLADTKRQLEDAQRELMFKKTAIKRQQQKVSETDPELIEWYDEKEVADAIDKFGSSGVNWINMFDKTKLLPDKFSSHRDLKLWCMNRYKTVEHIPKKVKFRNRNW